MSLASHARLVHFGSFALDLRSGELWKGSSRLRVPSQSIQILSALLEQPGELVTRDQLRARLWPSDTFVDFEHGLNAAIRRLREALGDSADTPTYIETLPRRGYRFIGAVERAAAQRHDTAVASLNRGTPRRAVVGVSAAAIVIASGLALLYRSFSMIQRVATDEPAFERLTANPSAEAVTSACISPDGRYLAFSDPGGLQVRFLDTGETHRFAETKGMNVSGWKPDSSGVLAGQCDDRSCHGWAISLIGQERHPTGAIWSAGDHIKVAPDGMRFLKITYGPDTNSVSIDSMDGAPARRLATGSIANASWSLDGRRILIARTDMSMIESVSVDGGTRAAVFRAPLGQVVIEALELPGRRLLLAMSPAGAKKGPSMAVELWDVETDERDVARGAARRLTSGIGTVWALSATARGHRATFLSTSTQMDVYVADVDLNTGAAREPRRLTFDDRDDAASSWTPDSQSLLLWSTRNGTGDIFKQAIDSETAEPFLTGPRDEDNPFVTSDHRWVLYTEGAIGDKSIMRVPLRGGAPEIVLPHVGVGSLQCAAHGRCVLVERAAGSFVVSSLDPLSGKGGELARVPKTEGYHILPDGNAFAYVVPAADGLSNRVRITSFTGTPSIDILVDNAARLTGLDWRSTGTDFFTTDRGRLLLVSRTGATKVLWSPAGLSVIGAMSSPDQRHLSINVRSSQSNAWMMTGFRPEASTAPARAR